MQRSIALDIAASCDGRWQMGKLDTRKIRRGRTRNPAVIAAMPPRSWASSPAVRRVMQGNKSRDTMPEIAVRRAVHAMGMRYRVAVRPLAELRRTADLVFRSSRVAVFIDGCFWHGCPAHHSPPKTNAGYWAQKIEGNRARDASTTQLLRAEGWTVLRFWSHEEPKSVAAHIASVLRNINKTTMQILEGENHVGY